MPLLLRKCAPSYSIEQLALKVPPPSIKSLARKMTSGMKKSSSGNTISSARRSTASTLSLSDSLSDGEDSGPSSESQPSLMASSSSSVPLSAGKRSVDGRSTMQDGEPESDPSEDQVNAEENDVNETASEAVEGTDDGMSEVASAYGVSSNPEFLEESVNAAVDKELVCHKRGFIRRLYTRFRKYTQLKRTLRSIRQEGVISSNGATNL